MRAPRDRLLKVWECLVENPVFPSDREESLKWFTKVCIHFKMKSSLLYIKSHAAAGSLCANCQLMSDVPYSAKFFRNTIFADFTGVF